MLMNSKTATDLIAEDRESGILESACPVTDEEFIKNYRKISGPSALRITLRLAALCAAKTSFSAERLTLKKVGLSPSKFSKYSQIGRDRRIEKIKDQLPDKTGYSVLYAMSQLSDEQWQRGFEDEVITPRSSRSEIDAFRTGLSRKKPPRHRSAPLFAAVRVTQTASPGEIAKFRAALTSVCEEFGCEVVFPTTEASLRNEKQTPFL